MPEKMHEKPGPVLDKKGRPNPGYATRAVLQYDRRQIKTPPFRLKEWDFYQVSDASHCLQFTIGHASYAGQVGIMFFDFAQGKMIADISKTLVLPRLSMPLDADADGTLAYDKDGFQLRFETAGDLRILSCACGGLEAEVRLRRQSPHALVINVPFDQSPRAFYYNHKINCMTAEGWVRYQGEEYHFEADRAFGLLDWGRGVWPFHNEWYWSNGTGYVGGEMLGFNLGCGFGNTGAATENIVFWRGAAHKIGAVDFALGGDYMQPWRLRDREGRLDLTLTPLYDRTTRTKLLWVDNCCHQMFGTFAGTVVMDDGESVAVENIVAFAEHAVNNW